MDLDHEILVDILCKQENSMWMKTPFPAVDPTHPQGQGPGDQSKVTQEVGD